MKNETVQCTFEVSEDFFVSFQLFLHLNWIFSCWKLFFLFVLFNFVYILYYVLFYFLVSSLSFWKIFELLIWKRFSLPSSITRRRKKKKALCVIPVWFLKIQFLKSSKFFFLSVLPTKAQEQHQKFIFSAILVSYVSVLVNVTRGYVIRGEISNGTSFLVSGAQMIFRSSLGFSSLFQRFLRFTFFSANFNDRGTEKSISSECS